MPAGTRKSLYSPDYDEFLVLLREVRLEAGLSQVELARRLGANQNFVSRSESGERRVDAREWLRICEACGVDPVEFLKRWTPRMQPPVVLSLTPEPPARSRTPRPS